jgi:translation initiation factor 3 subunit D
VSRLLQCRKYVEAGTGQVFMTDTVLTTLMCSPRSVYSWDIVIRKEGDKLFFDTREGSLLSHSTVAETAPEGVAEDKDNINGVQQLRSEATSIGHAFSQQVMQRCICVAPTFVNAMHSVGRLQK